MSQKDLVVKMTINSQDFDSGLKNAKGSMQKFNNDAGRMGDSFGKTIGKMGKAFSALGIALAAKDIFLSFTKSTETVSDTFEIEIGSMKDAWKDFIWQVDTANFSGFDNLISKARKAREELDKLEDASALFDLSTAKLTTDMDELLNTIQKKKKRGEDYSGEVNQYNQLLQEYRKSGELKKEKTVSSLKALFDKKGFNLLEMGLGGKGVDGYLELATTAREAAAGVYDDIINVYREARDNTATGDIQSEGEWVYSVEHDYMAELQKEKGFAWVQRAKILSDLADITSEEKGQIDALLKDYYATDMAIIQRDKKLNRYLSGEGGGGGGGSKKMKKDELTLDQLIEMESKSFQNEVLHRGNKESELIIDIPVEEEIIIEPETDALVESITNRIKKATEAIKQFKKTADEANMTLNAFSGLFSNLQALASDDSPWGSFAGAISGVLSQISGLITTYASLVAIESVAESIKAGNGIPFPYNLIAIAAAGTALLGIISSLKGSFKDAGSFATGGIVGGNSYTGDRLIAHVNSGEMIIPYNDWHNASQSNVHFIIEGSQLRGVLDNYDKTSNL